MVVEEIQQLQAEIQEDNKCLSDLDPTGPQNDLKPTCSNNNEDMNMKLICQHCNFDRSVAWKKARPYLILSYLKYKVN